MRRRNMFCVNWPQISNVVNFNNSTTLKHANEIQKNILCELGLDL